MMDRLKSFLHTEAAGGVALLIAAACAIAVANSPLADLYGQTLAQRLGPFTILEWVNDALMAIFFFVVGMEIKAELTTGALKAFDQAILPVVGAIGGMVMPALVFLFFAGETGGAHGWGIPMATDIAFAVGAMALLGKRVPTELKIFLLALAIADDLGAVLVIAFVYTKSISFVSLGLAAALFILIFGLVKKGAHSTLIYIPLGIAAWWFVHASGVHATIAGCILGFLVPHPRVLTQKLHGFSSFVIMPLFALANAGLSFRGVTASQVFTDPLVSGISYGLLIGKPLGIFGACFLAVKLKVARLAASVSWITLLGAACLGGIGFTMSLFVASLALSSPELLALAKIGIVKGSLLSALLGVVVLLGAGGYNESKRRARDR